MKLIFKTKNRRDFANFVFTKIANIVDGWQRFASYFTDGTSTNKKSISKYNLTNVIYISPKKVKVEDLVSGDNIRFFIEPFYQDSERVCYLSTQWRFKDGRNLDIGSVQEFINNEYSDIFKIVIENNEFSLFQINDDLVFEKLITNAFNTSQALQKIYFGSPGTGKSTELKRFVKDNNLELIRTTFHPDTDYHSFVGGYKPKMEGDKIIYKFMPQAFTKAYVKAHQNPETGYVLAIEEINRGNCASIFGDLFQCLDRADNGYSEYEIEAEADLADYLISEGLPTEITLPPNLLIYATMNTSDQSLFPMDAAFKRRWEWEYVPIKFNEESAKITIVFDTESYNWQNFVETINPKIEQITKSEDKKIGVYFITPTNGTEISIEQFKNKVMFYLWSEVCKDERDSPENFFQYLDNEGVPQSFSFNDLFESNGNEILKGFMKFNKIVLV